MMSKILDQNLESQEGWERLLVYYGQLGAGTDRFYRIQEQLFLDYCVLSRCRNRSLRTGSYSVALQLH